MNNTEIKNKGIGTSEIELMDDLLECFSIEFEDYDTYSSNRPDAKYQKNLLSMDYFIALAAQIDGKIVGGLAAYELMKFEQMRSEIYIYDLAVLKEYRRQEVATSLINDLKLIAKEKGAWVIFVQADHIDEPAIGLYNKLGTKEEVLHFDIPLNE